MMILSTDSVGVYGRWLAAWMMKMGQRLPTGLSLQAQNVMVHQAVEAVMTSWAAGKAVRDPTGTEILEEPSLSDPVSLRAAAEAVVLLARPELAEIPVRLSLAERQLLETREAADRPPGSHRLEIAMGLREDLTFPAHGETQVLHRFAATGWFPAELAALAELAQIPVDELYQL